MTGLTSFLPAIRHRTPPAVEQLDAALLLSDISGFTALSERLQARGREGAEEIAEVVSAAFAPAIRAIDRQRGNIVSFGGDSLFAMFPGTGAVHRAQAAAVAIQQVFAHRGEVTTSAGRVKLGVGQAVHHGKVEVMHLGTAERRHLVVTGAAVAALARLEARAGSGHLLLSPQAKAELEVEHPGEARPAASPRAPAAELRAYVPAKVAEMLRGFAGEYRKAAVLFLETRRAALPTMQRVFVALSEILDRYDGLLLKTDLSAGGTKWLCTFGIPTAHEDLADRAARAALDVVARLGKVVRLRGGLHAGVVANVIVGTARRRSFDVMGDVVNTAARALAKAGWGETVVTEPTRKLLSGVETEARGRHAVKGKAEPLELHALVGARSVAKQIRVSAPMVGRDAELAQVREALERARAGMGSVIAVEGLPGLGKSRLKYEAAKVARDMGMSVHEGRAISFGGMPYRAIGELLRHALGIEDGARKEAVLATVRTQAERLGMKAVDRHHLADVLGARYPDSPIQHLQPKDIRLNNTLAIRACILAMARQVGPQLLLLEDMHWADEMTREAAEWLAREMAGAPITMVLLHRPGYEPPKQARRMVLHELGEGLVGEMLVALLGEVPAKVAALVSDKAAGNPFYVEEVVRHLLESGILERSDAGYELVREPGAEDLPDSVELVIEARLDRLASDVKRVAQVGAVIGRTFLFEILSHLEREAARDGVADLVQRELLFERAKKPHLEYIFKHALTRDVAYAGILAARKRKLHAAVAQAIEQVLADERDSFLAMLGHHWELAGEREPARSCYLAGARRAAGTFAHEEAERLYRRYLGLWEEPTTESVAARNELAEKVLQLRGRLVEAEAEHRIALCEGRARGDRGAEAATLEALGWTLRQQGRMDEARTLSEQALAAFREVGNRRSEGTLLGNLGTLHMEQGRMDEARALFDQALAIHREVRNRQGESTTLGNLGVLHKQQGRMDEARALYGQALAVFRETGRRGREGVVLGNLGVLHMDQGRMDDARGMYEQALAIHREVGNRREEGIVLGNLGLLHMEQGRDEARTLYEQALAIRREVGDRRGEGIVLSNLGILHMEQGRMDDARALCEQALAIHREVGNPLPEGIVLVSLTRWHVLCCDDLAAAEALVVRAGALLLQFGDTCQMAELACARGHLALARGLDPTEQIIRTRQLAVELKAEPDSELGKVCARLHRAHAAFREGQPLICGHAPEDITPGQMRWLREHRPRVLPPALTRLSPISGR